MDGHSCSEKERIHTVLVLMFTVILWEEEVDIPTCRNHINPPLLVEGYISDLLGRFTECDAVDGPASTVPCVDWQGVLTHRAAGIDECKALLAARVIRCRYCFHLRGSDTDNLRRACSILENHAWRSTWDVDGSVSADADGLECGRSVIFSIVQCLVVFG